MIGPIFIEAVPLTRDVKWLERLLAWVMSEQPIAKNAVKAWLDRSVSTRFDSNARRYECHAYYYVQFLLEAEAIVHARLKELKNGGR